MAFGIWPDPTGIKDAFTYAPPRIDDARGWLSETVSDAVCAELGVRFIPAQENMSLSLRAGTVRGVHFQRAPHQQAKIMRVAHGAAVSVILDLRRGSSTFERAVSVRQTADARCLYIPAGCAHGVAALSDGTVLCWSVDNLFNIAAADGVHWADPALHPLWGVDPATAIVSPRDAALPLLAIQEYRFD